MAKHAKSGGVKLFSSKTSTKSSRDSLSSKPEREQTDDSYLSEFEEFVETPREVNPVYDSKGIFEQEINKVEEPVVETHRVVESESPLDFEEKFTNSNDLKNDISFDEDLVNTREIPASKVQERVQETESANNSSQKAEHSFEREVSKASDGVDTKRHKQSKIKPSRTNGKESKNVKVPTMLVFVLGFLIIAAVVYVLFFSDESDLPISQISPMSEEYILTPKKFGETDPVNFISKTGVMVDEEETEEYTPSYIINMPKADSYSSVEGIVGYLGNNFRNSSSYGTTSLIERTFGDEWNVETGSLKDAMGNAWTGNGWTGQPLVVRWKNETRSHITSMYEKYRETEGLVEVIMPCMDGKIYFMELESGNMTRDPLDIGYSFKGTGALDPRGYPILYVGSGADSELGKSRVFIINLLDNTVMYKFGYYEPFAQRDWNMWDSSPLIDAATDQLIYAGENGVVYIMHLNTMYDEAAGALTVNPDKVVKWRYTSTRTTAYTYWLGFESSPVCWQGMLYLADNGGNLMCLDLNLLELKWVKNVLDDTDCSPVLSIEEDGVYIYIGTSFHPGWRESMSASVPVWKIDAVTGVTVWERDFECVSSSGLSSGIQGNVVLGKNKLSGIVYAPVAEAGYASGGGYLVAMDSTTGETIWEFKTSDYSWSTPVLIYDSDGNGFVVYCTMDGNFYLIDGLTGNNVAMRSINGVIESSPVVFENTIVVGTRNSKIFGIQIK